MAVADASMAAADAIAAAAGATASAGVPPAAVERVGCGDGDVCGNTERGAVVSSAGVWSVESGTRRGAIDGGVNGGVASASCS